MNWNRILSVFIIIFLIINIGLYTYQKLQNRNNYTLSSSRIRQMEAVMKKKGVTMYAYLPDFYPKAKLELKMAEWNKKAILDHIFENQEYRSELTYEVALADTYQNKQQLVSFYTGEHNGMIYYKGENNKYKPENLSLITMEKKVIEFVQDLVGKEYEFEVTHRQIKGNGYLLDVNGIFKNEIIFSSYFQIKIDSEGIKEALGFHYDPIDFEENKREIYAFDEVMYYFMNKMEERGKEEITIKDADVGYYILDSNTKQLTIEATPVYRIILADDESAYYIDAYKNEFIDFE